jgi:hypothetical protein
LVETVVFRVVIPAVAAPKVTAAGKSKVTLAELVVLGALKKTKIAELNPPFEVSRV